MEAFATSERRADELTHRDASARSQVAAEPAKARTSQGKARPWQYRRDESRGRESVSSLAMACKRSGHEDGAMDGVSDPAAPDGMMHSDPARNDGLAEPLSPRELEVLVAICEGESNREIASKLAIRVGTVKYHTAHIFGKLGVLRRTQAVAVAIYLGLVRPEWPRLRPVACRQDHLE